MILAATDWLSISINLLLVLFVVICLLMTLMILMQRPKQEGLGAAFGGGMTDQMFGARTTNVLQRGTVWFATLFFVLALTLAVLIGMKNSREESLIDAEETEETQEIDDAPEIIEVSPEETVDTIRSLIDELPPGDEAPEEEPTEESTTPVETEPADTSDQAEENSEEP